MIAMRTVKVGIFHDNDIIKELGRPSDSEPGCFERNLPDIIFLMRNAPSESLQKEKLIKDIDVAIISFSEVNHGVRETVRMLDSANAVHGIAIIPADTELNPITDLTKGTCLEYYLVENRDVSLICHALDKIAEKMEEK